MIKQSVQPAIITVRKTEKRNVIYDFYFARGGAARKGDDAQEGMIVSVKRVPKIYSELPDAVLTKQENGWKKIGKISYCLYDNEAMIYSYFPKQNLIAEAKRLGYYLDSISTSDIVREFGSIIITSSADFKSSNIFGKPPPFIAQNEHVGLKVGFDGLWASAREYLLAKGRGIKEKVEIVRASKVPAC